MTPKQKEVINNFYELNQLNCSEFSTEDYCDFKTLRNEGLDSDDNIVIVTTTVKELNDNYIPVTETKNFLVDVEGNYYEMDMMPVFKDETEILSYIQTLKKFNWNE
jgi:hypothetical protein